MTITVDVSDFDVLEHDWLASVSEIGSGLEGVVRASAKSGEAAAKVSAPHRSYALRDSINGYVVDSSATSAEGVVSVGVPYAAAALEGSEPHVIEAKRKGSLSFVVGGQRVFRKRVFHPGTKAQPATMDAGERAADAKIEPEALSTVDAALANHRL